MSPTNIHSNVVTDTIEALINAYGAAAGRLDSAGQAALFTDDAELHGLTQLIGQGDAPLVGREAIRQFLGGSHGVVDYLHQHAFISNVEVRDDTATASCQLTEFCKLTDGDLIVLFGDFADTYRRIDGNWRFARRVFVPKAMNALGGTPLF